MLANLQHPVALARRGSEHAVSRLERRSDPALQGIGAEIPLHDEPRVAAFVESRNPSLEKSVQFVLAHADRRIGADRAECHVTGNIVRGDGVDIDEPERRSVAPHQVQRPFVDIDRPDGGMRGREGHRQRDRTPPAAEVEKIAPRGHGRHAGEKNGSSGIQTIRAEDAPRSGDVELTACERHADRTQVLGACRGRSEVMVGPHTASVPDTAG